MLVKASFFSSMKDAWCIVSSDPELSGSQMIRWYKRRWGIEPQFRDSKAIHFGMGLSHTRIRSRQRRDRLLLISALAVVILTLLGKAGEAIGFDKQLKANTVKHRTMSLFRQGHYYYHRLFRMSEEMTKKLLNKFQDILEKHQKVSTIIGVL